MGDKPDISDALTFAFTSLIDADLKRKGEYKDDIRNKLTSGGGSVFLGAVGTAVGGPGLGIIMGGLGHIIGQAADFDDDSDLESTSNDPRPNIEYSKIRKGLFDYDKL